jgi:hypothetical protein
MKNKSKCPFCGGTKVKPFVRAFTNQNCTDCDSDGMMADVVLEKLDLDEYIENRVEKKAEKKRLAAEKAARAVQPALLTDIAIGTKFIRRGTKRKDVETVVDIYRTYNLQGDLVKTMYVVEHMFMGQNIRSEVVSTTIKRGTIIE